MDLAELNLIGDFEAGIKCLQQNPSLLSKLSLIDKFPQLYTSFWTWGALILAVFATFTSVFNRIKLSLYQIRLNLLQKSFPQNVSFALDDDDFDFDFSDDGAEDDDTPSSVAESDDDDEGYDSEDGRVDEVFRAEGGSSSYYQGQNGNFTLRRRNGFSWSDFSAGKSVVQLWDSFGLGLDFEEDDDDESEIRNEIGIWDLDRDVKISSGGRWPAAENVVVTAEMDGGVGFGGYGSTVDPEIYAAWRPRQRKIWSDGGGVAGAVAGAGRRSE